MNYENWYNKFGNKKEEEIEAWLNNVPSGIDIQEDLGIFDATEFTISILQEEYISFIDEINDSKFEEYKDSKND